jgi:hypothetical protein
MIFKTRSENIIVLKPRLSGNEPTSFENNPRTPGRTHIPALAHFGEGCPKSLVIWAVMRLSRFRGYHSDHFFNSIR